MPLTESGGGGMRQVALDGAWLDVPPRRGAFVVNIGDMLGARLGGGSVYSAMEPAARAAPPSGASLEPSGRLTRPRACAAAAAERWSNGLYRSTRHRVLNRAGVERFSIPFFYEPNFYAVVAALPQCVSAGQPQRFPPITAGAYLLGRYAETHAAYTVPADHAAGTNG